MEVSFRHAIIMVDTQFFLAFMDDRLSLQYSSIDLLVFTTRAIEQSGREGGRAQSPGSCNPISIPTVPWGSLDDTVVCVYNVSRLFFQYFHSNSSISYILKYFNYFVIFVCIYYLHFVIIYSKHNIICRKRFINACVYVYMCMNMLHNKKCAPCMFRGQIFYSEIATGLYCNGEI